MSQSKLIKSLFSRQTLALFLSLILTIEAGATGFGWFEPLKKIGRSLFKSSPKSGKTNADPTKQYLLGHDKPNGQAAQGAVARIDSNLEDYAPIFLNAESQIKLAEAFRRQEALEKVSPSALRKTGQFFKKHFIGGAARFPIEATAFFVALGAKATLELITNYPDHPNAIADFINGQTDPVGIISFYFFVAFSGMTGELLNTFIKNKAMQFFTPFLGMAVGSFVQQHTSQIMYDPNFQTCAKNLVTRDVVLKNSPQYQLANQEIDPMTGNPLPRSKATPCANAWHDLVTQHKISDEVPGLISMLLAAVLSGFTEEVFILAATSKPLRFLGFAIQAVKQAGTFVVNSSLPGKAAFFIKAVFTQVPKAYLFVTYNDLVEVPVSYAFREAEDDEKIQELQLHLVESILQEKSQKWSLLENKKICAAVESEEEKDCIKDLPYYLEKFTYHMRNRRKWLLRNVYNPSHQWEEHLKNFAGIRASSYHVYQNYVEALDEYKRSPPNQKKASRFFQTAPLSGVNLPEDLALSKDSNDPGLRDDILKAINPNSASTNAPLSEEQKQLLLFQLQANQSKYKGELYSEPKQAEFKQREVVVIAGKLLNRFLRDSQKNNEKLSVDEKQRLTYLRDVFYNEAFEDQVAQFRNNGGPEPDFDKDILAKGRALEMFNKYYPSEYILSLPTPNELLHKFFDENRPHTVLFKPHSGELYFKYMMDVKRVLGNPKPILNPGYGWTYALEKHSPANKQIEFNDEDRTLSHFETPLITDHILVGMMCGPDLERNESIALDKNNNLAGISVPKGIPSAFIPPKIAIDTPVLHDKRPAHLRADNGKPVYLNLCDLDRNKFRDLHTLPLSPSSDTTKVYHGVLDYMAHNTRENVGGSSKVFEKWWSDNVDKEAKKAMDNFQMDYIYLVSRLASLIKIGDTESDPDAIPDSVANPQAKKPTPKWNDLPDIKEETKEQNKPTSWYQDLYYKTKKSLQKKWKTLTNKAADYTQQHFTDDFMPRSTIETARQELRIYLMLLGEILKDNLRLQNKIPIRSNELDSLYGQELKFPLFRDIRFTKNYDFENMLNAYAPNQYSKGQKGNAELYPFQVKLESAFTALFKTIKSLTAVETINGPVIISPVTQEALDAQQKTIVEQLTELSDVFDVGHGFAEAQGTAELMELFKKIPIKKKKQEGPSSDSNSLNKDQKETIKPLVKGLGPREKRTVKLALKGMQMIAEEITNLGKIVNAMAFIPTKLDEKEKEMKEKTGVPSILPHQESAPKRRSILGQEGG